MFGTCHNVCLDTFDTQWCRFVIAIQNGGTILSEKKAKKDTRHYAAVKPRSSKSLANHCIAVVGPGSTSRTAEIQDQLRQKDWIVLATYQIRIQENDWASNNFSSEWRHALSAVASNHDGILANLYGSNVVSSPYYSQVRLVKLH